jgi:hypothetical protein
MRASARPGRVAAAAQASSSTAVSGSVPSSGTSTPAICNSPDRLHNSRPWLFRLGAAHIDGHADRTRQLTVLNPAGRELLISVGAAVFTLRLALRGLGRRPDVRLVSQPANPTWWPG